jgi:hypothetical protein
MTEKTPADRRARIAKPANIGFELLLNALKVLVVALETATFTGFKDFATSIGGRSRDFGLLFPELTVGLPQDTQKECPPSTFEPQCTQ